MRLAVQRQCGMPIHDASLLWEDSLTLETKQFAVQFDSLNETQKRTLKSIWMAYVEVAATDEQVENGMKITKDTGFDSDVTGIAFICTLKKQRFITYVAGLCHRHPTFTRGMVASLDDELSEIVHGREQNETR